MPWFTRNGVRAGPQGEQAHAADRYAGITADTSARGFAGADNREMARGVVVGREGPPVAELHLQCGPGLVYGVLAVGLLGLGVVVPVSYVLAGRWVMAIVCLALLLLGWFCGRLSLPMLRTRLTADAAGVRGRTPDDEVVDVGWASVGIDADGDFLLMTIGAEDIRLSAGAWIGFWDFVALLYLVPDASRRLSPAARTEVAGYLGRATGPS